MRTVALLAAGLAALALPAGAAASQLIARDAKDVSLAVNGDGVALVTYRTGKAARHVLAWGAINADQPERGAKQVAFRLDYSGGWKSRHDALWKHFANGCAPYDGPDLHWLVTACKAPDGTYWALQSWQRSLPDLGVKPRTARQNSWDLRLSHWSGEPPKLWISMDWAYRQHFEHLYGSFTYDGDGVYGFRATSVGNPLDDFGRNVYLDTLDSAYGPGWKRENSFLTHAPGGTFCYGLYPHQNGSNRPSGVGKRYRATVIGPGVTPDAYWEAPAPGPFDPELEAQAAAQQKTLFAHDSACRPR